MKTLLENGLVVTMDSEKRIGNFSVLVDNDDIASVATEKMGHKYEQDISVIDASNMIIIPGFINGHIHGDMLLARGLGDGLSLHQQGGNSLPGRKKWFSNQLNSKTRALSRELQYIEALRSGTTFICDFLFWTENNEKICSPFEKTGINGSIVIDYRRDFLNPQRRSDNELKKIFNNIRKNGYIPMLQGPSEEDFSTELLLDLKRIAKEEVVNIVLHLAETQLRKEIIEKKFGMTPVKYLNKIGFLGPEIIGSHGVHIDDEEISMMVNNGTAIINSPVAEMKISDGAAPMAQFIRNGGIMGLGTDGALWNDSANMFGEMKTLMLLQRLQNGASSFSAYEALEAATIKGAHALGLDKSMGSIESGKKASLTMIDINKPHIAPIYHGNVSNVVETLVSCVQPSDVDTVFVNGEIVLGQGEFRKLDELKKIEEIQELGTRLFSTLN